jgi:FixJ family two-component response regulator
VDAAKKLVIVVDDDSHIRESLENFLKSAEFSAAAFPSAEDVLHSGLLNEARCLITDVRMPGIQGVELQRRLKCEYPNLPVIIVTAHRDERIRQSALSDGAAFFFDKPFDPIELLGAVQSAIYGSAKDG